MTEVNTKYHKNIIQLSLLLHTRKQSKEKKSENNVVFLKLIDIVLKQIKSTAN